MSKELTKGSKFVKAYYSADENLRRRVRTRFDKYLKSGKVTLSVLSGQLTELLGVQFNRKSTKGLLDYLGYPEKDKELIAQAKREAGRTNGKQTKAAHIAELTSKMKKAGLTKEKFKELWETWSFKEIETEYGFSQNDTHLIGQHLNLGEKVNRQLAYTYKDLYSDLIKAGETDESIKEMYIDNLVSISSMMERYKELLNDNPNITEKRVVKMLAMLGLNRTTEQIRIVQGYKSQREKAAAFARLERSGKTLVTLAKRYEEDYSLTKRALLRELNSFVEEGEPLFTERWLERHLNPLLSKVRLGSVSRSELEFRNELIKLLPNERMETSVRSLIPPREVDIYFPDRGIAIEFNGDYWHSDKFIKENHGMTATEYHELKRSACKAKGVDLYFVWESDWVERDELVLHEVLSLFKES